MEGDSKNNQQASIGQSVILGHFEAMIEMRKPVKVLEKHMFEGMGDKQMQNILGGADPFQVSALAIDALGNGDPQFLTDLYERGGKIEDEVVADLATAVIWEGRRQNCDVLTEFKKLSERHGRNT